MITMHFNSLIAKIVFTWVLIVLLLPGCQDNFLTENPKDRVSESIFWKNEKQIEYALTGTYSFEEGYWTSALNGWNIKTILFAEMTDIARTKFSPGNYGLQINRTLPTNNWVASLWSFNYQKISRCNYFLENIDKVNMDEDEKAEMIAEVRFLRSYAYFWLSQMYGRVPLIKKVLTFDEANSVGQTSQEEVVNFILTELTEAAQDLPAERTSSESGRIEKGAAMALKGRLLMSQERWSEAATTYKEIMDLNRYVIDPTYKELFEDAGDNSDEIIFDSPHIEQEFGEAMTQKVMPPSWYAGNNQMTIFQEFVDKFLMIDGDPIEESDLYDPNNPFENRDPRLYATVFLPSYSKAKGKIYRGHPDSLTKAGQTGPGLTGYGMRKFYDTDYTGNVYSYGGDYPLIRYAEVLLSRLESELEAGNVINQNLLDNTINKVRQREAVDMPSVSETAPNELRQIIRRERVVELAMEGGLRYWDLRRWGIADEVLNGEFHGMKLTDNPDEYTGSYVINDEGYLYSATRYFDDYNYLWPIPQSEMDVNSNLEQNPGYQ